MNETPLFFQSHGSRLFGVLHVPKTRARHAAFVFCHPYAEEKLWAHRVFVSFARELAARGYMVLRFDYRGYGDSEGEFAHATVAQHLADIAAAVEFVRSCDGGIDEVGLLGYRLGATLALHSALKLKTTGKLILWDPLQDGKRFIQEFLRSNLTTQLAIYGEIHENREELVARISRGESVNVDGYEISKASYESIAGLKLSQTPSEGLRCAALVVQVGKTEKPKRDCQSLAEQLGASLSCVVEEPFWREIKRWYYRADNLFEATLAWLEDKQ